MKCVILKKKLDSINLGSTFSPKMVSIIALGIAKDNGINVSDKNLLDNLLKFRTSIFSAYASRMKIEEDKKKEEAGIAEKARKEKALKWSIKRGNIIVTTTDLKEDYEVIGPVYFQVSNKGIFSSQLSRLISHYSNELNTLKNNGLIGGNKSDWGFLYGEFSVGQNDFDKAFYVAVEELKARAALLGGNAIVGMRQDIDLDTTNIQHFYLQIYGTAVKFIETEQEEEANQDNEENNQE